MKIAYIYQSISSSFAEPFAVQLHIYHQLHGLQAAGHEAVLLGLQGRRVLCTGDLDVFAVHDRPERDFSKLGLSGNRLFKLFESAVRRTQKALRLPYLALFDSYRIYDAARHNLRGFDVIHERYNLLAFGGAWASRRMGIPYVLEVNSDLLEEREAQGTPERGLRRRFAVWATRYNFETAKRIICVSGQLADHLAQKWQVPREKLVVLPNAADTEAFGRAYNVAAVRADFGLPAGPLVMFVGGFYLWHDLALLVQSFAQVVQRVPEARLVLVGDGRTRQSVEQAIRDHGLQEAVIMTGPVKHSRVPELLATASVVVAPNIPFFEGHGGSPLKIFEYMAAGKAIVATRTGQVAEVIEEGVNGLLVPAGDAAALSNALLSLLEDEGLREKLGREARRRAVERHSWQQYARRLVEIYGGKETG